MAEDSIGDYLLASDAISQRDDEKRQDATGADGRAIRPIAASLKWKERAMSGVHRWKMVMS